MKKIEKQIEKNEMLENLFTHFGKLKNQICDFQTMNWSKEAIEDELMNEMFEHIMAKYTDLAQNFEQLILMALEN